MRAERARAHEIAALARRQHGVLTRAQLRAAGLTDSAIDRRRAAGHLHPLHRGVFAVGHTALRPEGWWLAAVLALGDSAILSHRSAAGLWRLLDPVLAPVHVTVSGCGGRRRRAGIRVHRSTTLGDGDATKLRGIPVTSPARTIADLRRELSPAELRRAIREAEATGLSTGLLRRAAATRSELEEMFLLLCRRQALPTPLVNARVEGLEVDFLWPGQRVVVETDGYRYHRGRAAFEDDRERDLRLRAANYTTIRLTHAQIRSDPSRAGSGR